jgi:hypothetical protein
MERRLGALLRDFRWGRMDDIFLRRAGLPAHPPRQNDPAPAAT